MSTVKQVIVGIDVGLTCTGVVFGIIWDTPNSVPNTTHVNKRWPGTRELLDKVPTKVTYTAGELGIHSWGASCPDFRNLSRGQGIKDHFKFFLDTPFVAEKFQRAPNTAPQLENVKLWYRDFLIALYSHIIHELQESFRVDVRSTPIEFLFSIPTKWKDNDKIMRIFRDLVDDAGFGNNVNMELTEGEAAAVFTACRLRLKFQHGDSFIVCDAGGGTTDMCVLRVKSIEDEIVELETLDRPRVLPVGSVNIDELFEIRIGELLRTVGNIPVREIDDLALQMTQGSFQHIKKQFGAELTRAIGDPLLDIPDTGRSVNFPLAELKEMFDIQIRQLIDGIDNQVGLLDKSQPHVRLKYLFLAGGLGSSEYVQSKIADHLRNRDMTVLFAPEPDELPLAVSKGLVIDRLQNFDKHLPVIQIRSSSSSYGILVRESYSEKHSGQPVRRDLLNDKRYAENQIDWLIRKDSDHQRGNVVHRFYSVLVDPSTAVQEWSFSVVRSTLDPEHLPTYLDEKSEVEVVCHVSSIPEEGLHESGVLKKRGIIPGKRKVFRQLDCNLSAKFGVGKFVFTSTIIGQLDAKPQELIVWWPRGDGEVVTCCDLIRNVRE